MSERVTGVVSAENEKKKTSVMIVISGKTSPQCLATMMLELKKSAKQCGLTLTVKNIRK